MSTSDEQQRTCIDSAHAAPATVISPATRPTKLSKKIKNKTEQQNEHSVPAIFHRAAIVFSTSA